VGDEGTIIAVDRYGASAPGAEIFQHNGLTAENVAAAALRLAGRPDEAEQLLGTAQPGVLA
jgi:transketolase